MGLVGLVAVLSVVLGPAEATASDGRSTCMYGSRFVVKVLKDEAGCSNARRALRGFMDSVYASDPPCHPGKCRSASPRRWHCQLENEQLTEEAGRTAKCKRDRDGSVGVLIFLGESPTGERLRAFFWQDCGDYGLDGRVTSHGVRCGKARRVISTFFTEAQEEGADIHVKGFRCHGRVTDSGEFNVKCERNAGRDRVRFKGALS